MSIEKGQTIDLTITGIAGGGDGVGRHLGMAVFVPGVCPGERVLARVFRVTASCAYAELVSVLVPSPSRRDDFCAVSGACGGCDFAHMKYDEQLIVKRTIVEDALRRIGGFSDVIVENTLPAPRAERYRNKMVFPLGKGKKGEAIGGFYAPKSHSIIPLSDCRQGDKAASSWLSAVLSYLNETNESVYDEASQKGLARRFFVRLSEGTGEAMAVLTICGDRIKNPELLVEKLLAVKADFTLKSILLNIHKEPNNLLLGPKNKVLFGRDYIVDTLGTLTFHISPHSFYQINAPQTERLYGTALSLASLQGDETVLDLYCGIGTISLFAAKQARHVIGVEIVPQAIEDARKNAERNGILNAEFICGKAEEVAPELVKQNKAPDVVILDPPRKGAEKEALSAILTMAPEKIVYVSCNPATLARDVKFLCEGGYALKTAVPADMFPNTSHVECVVRLCRN